MTGTRFEPHIRAALAALTPRATNYPSPTDWRDQVLYMLLPDRFSDGREAEHNRLNRQDLPAGRQAGWDALKWAESGHYRFQGGTLGGVTSKLPYLSDLGVTAIWLGPPWKQRAEGNSYHGYAIQDFLDVDPRFGSREDLVELVAQAHQRKIRVILDVIVNHTGPNWWYDDANPDQPSFRAHDQGPYGFDCWLDGDGVPLPAGAAPLKPDDGVWPTGVLQNPDAYHRQGHGDYGKGEPISAFAEFRIADYFNRDLALTDGNLRGQVLQTLIDCWTYWLYLTDCDGFRIDTFKHFRIDEGRTFCGAIRERAEAMGKDNFLLVAEVAGGEQLEEDYLTLNSHSLSSVLEISNVKNHLQAVAGGDEKPAAFFDAWPHPTSTEASPTSETLPWQGNANYQPASHRDYGKSFVYLLDDHDNVWQEKLRFATLHPGLSVPAVALLTLTLGIPCLYYGTEQALALPADVLVASGYDKNAPAKNDRYLREAMFGPEHPRRSGRAGFPSSPDPTDPDLPGFGAFGTSGRHVFDPTNPTYRRVAAILRLRQQESTLRRGRQYLRTLSLGGGPFAESEAGGLVAWSRILSTTEVVCVANLSTTQTLGARIDIDPGLELGSPSALSVLLDTTTLDPVGSGLGAGSLLQVTTNNQQRWVTLPALGPAEVLVLTNA